MIFEYYVIISQNNETEKKLIFLNSDRQSPSYSYFYMLKRNQKIQDFF